MAEQGTNNELNLESSEGAVLPPEKEKVTEPQLKNLTQDNVSNGVNDISIITEIPLELTVELGRAEKSIKEILNFGIGTVVELNKLAGEHVELFANGKLLAKGEVVVVDDNFAIKITEIVNKKTEHQND